VLVHLTPSTFTLDPIAAPHIPSAHHLSRSSAASRGCWIPVLCHTSTPPLHLIALLTLLSAIHSVTSTHVRVVTMDLFQSRLSSLCIAAGPPAPSFSLSSLDLCLDPIVDHPNLYPEVLGAINARLGMDLDQTAMSVRAMLWSLIVRMTERVSATSTGTGSGAGSGKACEEWTGIFGAQLYLIVMQVAPKSTKEDATTNVTLCQTQLRKWMNAAESTSASGTSTTTASTSATISNPPTVGATATAPLFRKQSLLNALKYLDGYSFVPEAPSVEAMADRKAYLKARKKSRRERDELVKAAQEQRKNEDRKRKRQKREQQQQHQQQQQAVTPVAPVPEPKASPMDASSSTAGSARRSRSRSPSLGTVSTSASPSSSSSDSDSSPPSFYSTGSSRSPSRSPSRRHRSRSRHDKHERRHSKNRHHHHHRRRPILTPTYSPSRESSATRLIETIRANQKRHLAESSLRPGLGPATATASSSSSSVVESNAGWEEWEEIRWKARENKRLVNQRLKEWQQLLGSAMNSGNEMPPGAPLAAMDGVSAASTDSAVASPVTAASIPSSIPPALSSTAPPTSLTFFLASFLSSRHHWQAQHDDIGQDPGSMDQGATIHHNDQWLRYLAARNLPLPSMNIPQGSNRAWSKLNETPSSSPISYATIPSDSSSMLLLPQPPPFRLYQQPQKPQMPGSTHMQQSIQDTSKCEDTDMH